MTITAKIIADSISPEGIRLTTMQLRYPRFVHAEFMTHRVFSRNASSSRAIPVERLIQDVIDDPAMPVSWGKNQRGMQAGEECDEVIRMPNDGTLYARDAWFHARDLAVDMARRFAAAGYHKQVVNRLLEPFSHINVVVSATEWANFYGLRNHPDADPTIQALARAMKEAHDASTPRLLQMDEWHLPYIMPDDWDALDEIDHEDVLDRELSIEVLIKISVARCARVSYLTHDGRKTTVEEDLALYERLVGSQPLHASPAEHQATPDGQVSYGPGITLVAGYDWLNPNRHGNFRGWIQYRKTLPNEVIV